MTQTQWAQSVRQMFTEYHGNPRSREPVLEPGDLDMGLMEPGSSKILEPGLDPDPFGEDKYMQLGEEDGELGGGPDTHEVLGWWDGGTFIEGDPS